MAVPAESNILVDHLGEMIPILAAVISPLVLTIVGLAVWAFGQQGKNLETITKTMEEQAKENDRIHGILFKESRAEAEKLNKLVGEHNVQHRGSQ
jgi:hypothetical protein